MFERNLPHLVKAYSQVLTRISQGSTLSRENIYITLISLKLLLSKEILLYTFQTILVMEDLFLRTPLTFMYGNRRLTTEEAKLYLNTTLGTLLLAFACVFFICGSAFKLLHFIALGCSTLAAGLFLCVPSLGRIFTTHRLESTDEEADIGIDNVEL